MFLSRGHDLFLSAEIIIYITQQRSGVYHLYFPVNVIILCFSVEVIVYVLLTKRRILFCISVS